MIIQKTAVAAPQEANLTPIAKAVSRSASAPQKLNLMSVLKMAAVFAMTLGRTEAAKTGNMRAVGQQQPNLPNLGSECTAFNVFGNDAAAQELLGSIQENSAFCPHDKLDTSQLMEKANALFDEHARRLDADRNADTYIEFARSAFETSIGLLGVNLSDVSIQAVHDGLAVSLPALVTSLVFAARAVTGDSSLQGYQQASDAVVAPLVDSLGKAAATAVLNWSEATEAGKTDSNGERFASFLNTAVDGLSLTTDAKAALQVLTGVDWQGLVADVRKALTDLDTANFRSSATSTLDEATTTLSAVNQAGLVNEINGLIGKFGKVDIETLGSETVSTLQSVRSLLGTVPPEELEELGLADTFQKLNNVLDEAEDFLKTTKNNITAITVCVGVACVFVMGASALVGLASLGVNRASGGVNQAANTVNRVADLMNTMIGEARTAATAAAPIVRQAANDFIQVCAIALGNNPAGATPENRRRGQELGQLMGRANDALGTVGIPQRVVQPFTALAAYGATASFALLNTLLQAVGYGRQAAPVAPAAAGGAPDAAAGAFEDVPVIRDMREAA